MTDIIYKTNGEVIETSPKNGTNYTLDELKEIVGGYIEIIHLTNNKIMLINDEGKLINLPHNENATILYRLCLDTTDFIVGDVLVYKIVNKIFEQN